MRRIRLHARAFGMQTGPPVDSAFADQRGQGIRRANAFGHTPGMQSGFSSASLAVISLILEWLPPYQG